jgi:hypothetical protein
MNVKAETEFVEAFVVPQKRERYVEFLQSPKRRSKLLAELYHFTDFNPAYLVPLAGSIDSADGVISELRKRGAPANCQVISTQPELDGTAASLSDVIHKVFAFAEGTIVICGPGKLGYYEGEAPKNRFILDCKNLRTRRLQRTGAKKHAPAAEPGALAQLKKGNRPQINTDETRIRKQANPSVFNPC